MALPLQRQVEAMPAAADDGHQQHHAAAVSGMDLQCLNLFNNKMEKVVLSHVVHQNLWKQFLLMLFLSYFAVVLQFQNIPSEFAMALCIKVTFKVILIIFCLIYAGSFWLCYLGYVIIGGKYGNRSHFCCRTFEETHP